jgi:Ca2+-binding RTX toxin-like protein
VLIGGVGADRYVFGANSGADSIFGFSQGEGDKLDFGGQTLTSADDGQGGTLFTLSGGGTRGRRSGERERVVLRVGCCKHTKARVARAARAFAF